MADPAQNTGYEPNLANLFRYKDLEHTPMIFPDSHHDFQSSDNTAVIHTCPEERPSSRTSSSSKQMNVRSSSHLETECRSCVKSLQASGNWSRVGQRISCNIFFNTQFKWKKKIETQTLCIRRQTEKIIRKILNGKLTRPSEFLFPFYLTHLLSHFFPYLKVRRQPAHSAQREYGLV